MRLDRVKKKRAKSERLLSVLFSVNFERFITPVIIASSYGLGIVINGVLAVALEIVFLAELSGFTPLTMSRSTLLLGLFLIPLSWLGVQVLSRVIAEMTVALVKIAENTSR